MFRCRHMFESKGKFYSRRKWLFGGQLFTVFRYRECVHCSKPERKVVKKMRVTESPDTVERQLRFSGVKPESQLE